MASLATADEWWCTENTPLRIIDVWFSTHATRSTTVSIMCISDSVDKPVCPHFGFHGFAMCVNQLFSWCVHCADVCEELKIAQELCSILKAVNLNSP